MKHSLLSSLVALASLAALAASAACSAVGWSRESRNPPDTIEAARPIKLEHPRTAHTSRVGEMLSRLWVGKTSIPPRAKQFHRFGAEGGALVPT